jgi:hypothetical protein
VVLRGDDETRQLGALRALMAQLRAAREQAQSRAEVAGR